MSRETFHMTEDDHAALIKCIDIARNRPLIAINTGTPPSVQQMVNEAWASLGERMGFDAMTVEPGGDRLTFTAVPTCPGIEIEPGVWSGCNQSHGDCPTCGK